MVLEKACDAVVIRDERARKLDRGGDQQPIRRIAVLETMQLIAAGGSAMTQWHRFDAGTFDEARDPRLNRNIELDPSGIDQQRNLPGSDRTQANGSAVLPAIVDQSARRWAQAVIAAVEPEGDMRVEQQRIRSISRPISASGSTSRADAIRSTPLRIRTEPR